MGSRTIAIVLLLCDFWFRGSGRRLSNDCGVHEADFSGNALVALTRFLPFDTDKMPCHLQIMPFPFPDLLFYLNFFVSLLDEFLVVGIA
jgi:hypothetical protein